MWTDIKNNTNMGLQSSLATKRKHELTLTSEKELEFQSSCPPLKTTKWSSDSDNNTQENNNNNINSNNNNNTNNNDNNNNQEQQAQKQLQRQPQDSQHIQENNLNETSSNLIKLEVVTATPNDLWNPEPVDCISKLQAVAVPTDTWGSLTTRSTLATTLLSADELEDDDDDFDDDYEEEESIIPTYCPVRYSCPPPHFLQRNGGNNNNNNNTNNNNNNNNNNNSSNGNNGANSYTTHNTNNISHSYIGKPNYYSEPFPQQNCSRTINQQQQQSQHFRFGTLNSWNHLNSHQNNSYYSMQSVEPISPIGSSNGSSINGGIGYTQQTIRCAENGKSYLELGSSTFTTTNLTPNNSNHNNNLNTRHSKKCGCDGRGTWCNNKNCYRDIRMKIRNLSMFKLSKFRQVSEQSLYRSVLICNTLKNIDREIELENKDSHHLHHNLSHHMSPHLHHPLNPPHHHHNSPLSSLVNNNNNDFSPIGSCTKICAIQHDPTNSLAFQPINQFGNMNNSDNESIREYNIIQQHQQQQQHHQHQQQSMLAKSSSSILFSNNSNINQHCPNELLHPYDHYPFREAQLGRATPFPVGSNDSENTDNIPITSQSLSSISNNNTNNNINNSINFASNNLPIVSNSISQASTTSSSLTTTTLTPIINSTTPTTTINHQQNPASISPESDSGFSDDDSNRSINWSSVLSLSSQSALDPLNNSDLFSILPSPAIPTPISTTSTNLICNNNNISNNSTLNTSLSSSSTTVATNSTLTANSNRSNQINNNSTSNNNSISTSNNNINNSNSTTHVTTLSTLTTLTSSSSSSFPISITTTTTNHQLLENNNNCLASSIQTNNSTWEYNFLDMDLGISSSELTELVPPHHCKLTSDDLFKSISTPLNTARYVHDNEIESPAHIMVGS